jgi:hypothetical protein
MLSTLHGFYDEYYFRPKAIFRILKETVFDGRERKRIYREAKSFLKIHSMRKKLVAASSQRNSSEETHRSRFNGIPTAKGESGFAGD